MAQITRGEVRTRKGTAPPKPTKTGAIVGRKPGESDYIKFCVFGPPKTGKRTFACSGKNVLLIQFDPGGDATETLRGRDDITVVEPKNRAEIDDLIKQLRTGGTDQFDWVIVSSLTFLFFMLGGKSISKAYKDGSDIRRAYGAPGAEVQQIIHDLVTLDTNVGFIAHLERVSAEDDKGVSLDAALGQTEVKIAVSPMVWKILGPAVGFIARSFKEDVWEAEEGKKTRNKRTRYAVSLNDGDKSPAGSRLPMAAEYEITTTLLSDIQAEIGKQ